MAKKMKTQTVIEDISSDVEILNHMELDDADHKCFLCIEGERLIKEICRFGNQSVEQSDYKSNLPCDDPIKSHFNTQIQGQSKSILNESNTINEEVSNLETLKKLFTCKVCHKTFSEARGLKEHITKFHSSITYSCDVCKTSFTDVTKFRLHCSEHVDSDNGLFLCSTCGKKFLWKSLFKQHTCVHTK
ncbi:zinc finger protein 235-like [Stegodyphus dumicola]|uniref:zinc finger protein 235-like n=1 Tax=Stegodyphus dumicola TaxID=202533 RepID=UPI0015AE9D91|nr:zinc finger protein 235-like [Stegodyphus dumicola]